MMVMHASIHIVVISRIEDNNNNTFKAIVNREVICQKCVFLFKA